jgi:CBS domain-containing protein
MCTLAGEDYKFVVITDMIAKELITEGLLPLRISDTGTTALMQMDEYKVGHLPVVEEKAYLGLLSEPELFNLPDPDHSLQYLLGSLQRIYVYETDHVFEVVRLFNTPKVTVVPVLNDADEYSGTITLNRLITCFASLLSVDFPGALIILELNINDYLLSEIARIVETNDAKILSVYLTPHKESTKLDVTIRINQADIRSVLQTFSRYNYTVKAIYSQRDPNEDLRDRYESLMRYLNI